MVARRRATGGVRKVRAPQRRVAGNSRPPRGEDQRHSDDAGFGRSETRQALPGARPNRRAQLDGATRRGRGALPSPRVGRMSRRATGGPRWMAIRDGASRSDKTRLTDRLADTSPLRPRLSADPTNALERPRWSAWNGHRGRGPSAAAGQSSSGRNVWGAVQALQIGAAEFEVAEGDRHAAVRQQALHVVHPVRAGLDLDQAPERAPLDPLGREPIRLRIRGDDRQWQGHRVRTGPRSHIGRATVPVGRRSLTSPEMPRQHAKRTRLAPSSEGICVTEGSWRRTAAPR